MIKAHIADVGVAEAVRVACVVVGVERGVGVRHRFPRRACGERRGRGRAERGVRRLLGKRRLRRPGGTLALEWDEAALQLADGAIDGILTVGAASSHRAIPFFAVQAGRAEQPVDALFVPVAPEGQSVDEREVRLALGGVLRRRPVPAVEPLDLVPVFRAEGDAQQLLVAQLAHAPARARLVPPESGGRLRGETHLLRSPAREVFFVQLRERFRAVAQRVGIPVLVADGISRDGEVSPRVVHFQPQRRYLAALARRERTLTKNVDARSARRELRVAPEGREKLAGERVQLAVLDAVIEVDAADAAPELDAESLRAVLLDGAAGVLKRPPRRRAAAVRRGKLAVPVREGGEGHFIRVAVAHPLRQRPQLPRDGGVIHWRPSLRSVRVSPAEVVVDVNFALVERDARHHAAKLILQAGQLARA